MRLRSKLRPSPEIPTSSMADIAFLLIIFFMLTAVFTSNQGLRFAFPDDDPEDLEVQPEEAIHLKITGSQSVFVDGKQMTYEEVGGYIQSKMDVSPNKPVIIQTLPDVEYSVMINYFDLLKALEVKNIAIPTRSEIERWKQFGVFE